MISDRKVVGVHPILKNAVADEIEGFKEAALEIAERVYARPITDRCMPENFRDTVKQECDWWLQSIGEPAYGHPYTDNMRENFYRVITTALGEAFCTEGYV